MRTSYFCGKVSISKLGKSSSRRVLTFAVLGGARQTESRLKGVEMI